MPSRPEPWAPGSSPSRRGVAGGRSSCFAVAILSFATLDHRMARAERPERPVATTLLTISVVLAIAAALTGGAHSPALAWLVVPAAMAAIRFRSSVVIAVRGGVHRLRDDPRVRRGRPGGDWRPIPAS